MPRGEERTADVWANLTKDKARAPSKLRGMSRPAVPNLTEFKEAVDLVPSWVGALPINPITAIHRSNNTGAILKVLDLLKVEWDETTRRLRSRVRKFALENEGVKAIHRKQLLEGGWPIRKGQEQEAAKQLEFIASLENLHGLATFGGNHGWPTIKKGLRAFLQKQLPDGRFPGLYHHHAASGSLLMTVGMDRSPAVHKAAHWIAERQREDGGWLHPHMPTKRDASCIWTTVEVLAFLSKYRTTQIKEGLGAASDFVLDHALKANTTTLLPGEEAWNHLAMGSTGNGLFMGGTLKALEGLTFAGSTPADSRFKKLYTWLIEQQLPNGLFPAIVGMNSNGDPMVTARVLAILKFIETTRPEAKQDISADSEPDISHNDSDPDDE